MIFLMLFLVYLFVSISSANNTFLSKSYSLYKIDKIVPGYQQKGPKTILGCGMLCFAKTSCKGFGFHEGRRECLLYDIYPVECQEVVIDIGMKIYVPSEEDKTNVALGKPAFMSTFHNLPYLPCNCVDGNTANDRPTVCHTQKLNPNWFCVDLQDIYTFKYITIYNRHDGGSINRIVNFQIRLSSTGGCDSTTFVNSPRCYQDTSSNGVLVYNITGCTDPLTFSSRYVFLSNHNGQFLTFSELKVHAN